MDDTIPSPTPQYIPEANQVEVTQPELLLNSDINGRFGRFLFNSSLILPLPTGITLMVSGQIMDLSQDTRSDVRLLGASYSVIGVTIAGNYFKDLISKRRRKN